MSYLQKFALEATLEDLGLPQGWLDFPGGLDNKEPEFDPWVGKIPWRRKWKPILVFLPGKSHGQRSLVGYSPWGLRVRHNWVTNSLQSISENWVRRWFSCFYLRDLAATGTQGQPVAREVLLVFLLTSSSSVSVGIEHGGGAIAWITGILAVPGMQGCWWSLSQEIWRC